jgi:hypothetical protein
MLRCCPGASCARPPIALPCPDRGPRARRDVVNRTRKRADASTDAGTGDAEIWDAATGMLRLGRSRTCGPEARPGLRHRPAAVTRPVIARLAPGHNGELLRNDSNACLASITKWKMQAPMGQEKLLVLSFICCAVATQIYVSILCGYIVYHIIIILRNYYRAPSS